MHKLTLTYDEETGRVTAEHRTICKVGEHLVSHAEPIELADPDGAAAALKAMIDANRAEMEQRTQALAVQHVAAVTGKQTPNTKALRVGGNLAALGGAAAKKE